jgi:hypothetical protein
MQQPVAMNPMSQVTKSAPPKIPPEIRALLGPPPLLMSEDPTAYETLLATFGTRMRPTDEIEWIHLKDCVDLTWEIQRYRRAKAGIIDVTRKEALQSILESILEQEDVDHGSFSQASLKAHEWYTSPNMREELTALLARHGLDENAITAQALALRARELAKIEQMLASAEQRRSSMFREIAAYRGLFSCRLRYEIESLDEEFSLPPPGSG